MIDNVTSKTCKKSRTQNGHRAGLFPRYTELKVKIFGKDRSSVVNVQIRNMLTIETNASTGSLQESLLVKSR